MRWLLIAPILLITITGGGAWYMYQCGYRLPDSLARYNGLIAPVPITDTATSYTLIQKYQIERADDPFPHRAEIPELIAPHDAKTFVPPPVRYIRVEYLASLVEKPYPKIFFAEKEFPTDIWMLEDVAVVKPATMTKILTSAEKLSCAPNSAVLNIWTDQIEVVMRGSGKQLKRCLLDYKAGCKYLNRLHQLSRELGPTSGFVIELEKRMKCSPFLKPWEGYVAFPS